MTQTAGRDRSFDEDWRFAIGDPAGAQAPGFNDSGWRMLDLPHDWSIEDLSYAPTSGGGDSTDPSLLVYQPPQNNNPNAPDVIGPFDKNKSAGQGATGYMVGGFAWYRKTFTTEELIGGSALGGDGTHVELRFDGVYQNASVYLNGNLLETHPYGYTPISLDITSGLSASGNNVVAVRVDNSGLTSRWYSGSGIYRHTWLTVTQAVRIPVFGVVVTTPTVGRASATAHVVISVANLDTRAATAAVRIVIHDPHGATVAHAESEPATVAAGASGQPFSVDLEIANAKLWSPDSPNLYAVHAEVLAGGRTVDAVDQTFGIRSLTWNGTVGFQLNGQTIKVRGGCVHDTHGPLGAVGLNRTLERRIELLKAAGFNAIRTAHNPPTPALLDACDHLGMLVWDEFTDMWDAGKNPQDYSVNFNAWWQRDLTSMILRDRNHPSVVIWSLGNEIPEVGDYATLGPQIAALVRSLDSTRPISQGGGATAGPDDPSWQWCDVGDYHYNADGTGPEPLHSVHPPAALTQSESFPASMYDDWQITLANDYQVGNWVWAAIDYLGESGLGKTPVDTAGTAATVENQTVEPGWRAADTLYKSYDGYGYSYPWFQSNCGDLDLIGERKPQNLWRSAIQGTEPVSIVVARPTPAGYEQEAVWWGYFDEQASWNWDVADGEAMTVRVYTTGDSVALELNGKPINGVDSVVPSRARAVFTVPYAPGSLTAIASQRGSEIGRATITTAGQPAAVRLTGDVTRLTTGRDDLAHVLVEIVDGQGRTVPDATAPVSFAVNGAGELAGVANGNPENLDSFRQPRRYTWHGKAQAILRPGKQPGRVTLTASSPGLRPATLSLPVTASRATFGQDTSRREGVTLASRAAMSFGRRTITGPAVASFVGAAVIRRRLGNAEPEAPEADPDD
ncbi:MAG TPA: glycoside hydrolase family 2 TIM barrel-domain containing protein [Solirubrobacteraceae bacterium]|nr:glycoside hydrolase family 2 TIM barrel-domain containing protein [Solirubrobacteraceae bacterium]